MTAVAEKYERAMACMEEKLNKMKQLENRAGV